MIIFHIKQNDVMRNISIWIMMVFHFTPSFKSKLLLKENNITFQRYNNNPARNFVHKGKVKSCKVSEIKNKLFKVYHKICITS